MATGDYFVIAENYLAVAATESLRAVAVMPSDEVIGKAAA